jgi:transcriptional regulator with XRE-family HTH domain
MGTIVLVNIKKELMDTVGKRLREERLRLGLSQDEFASIGGLTRRTQTHYETDGRPPDTSYLRALAGIGVDVVYVLTGETSINTLSIEESEVLSGYRQLNEAGKAMVQAVIASGVNSGSMSVSGEPAVPEKRVKRLSENRRASLDAHTAKNVEKAMGELERLRADRTAKSKK